MFLTSKNAISWAETVEIEWKELSPYNELLTIVRKNLKYYDVNKYLVHNHARHEYSNYDVLCKRLKEACRAKLINWSLSEKCTEILKERIEKFLDIHSTKDYKKINYEDSLKTLVKLGVENLDPSEAKYKVNTGEIINNLVVVEYFNKNKVECFCLQCKNKSYVRSKLLGKEIVRCPWCDPCDIDGVWVPEYEMRLDEIFLCKTFRCYDFEKKVCKIYSQYAKSVLKRKDFSSSIPSGRSIQEYLEVWDFTPNLTYKDLKSIYKRKIRKFYEDSIYLRTNDGGIGRVMAQFEILKAFLDKNE